MANPGIGIRTANSILCEASLHMAMPICNATATQAILSGTQTVTVSSNIGIYAGCQVVLTDAAGISPPAIVSIASSSPGTVTATFPANYAAGSILLGATFPIQALTDPLFTQSEMLGYLARAQNDFLSRVPATYQFFYQNTLIGASYQTVPQTAIQLERVSLQGNRLYEVSQERLAMQNPAWSANPSYGAPTSWFEDRSGYYGWGLAPVPMSGFQAELLASVRDADSLILTDGVLVPDSMVMYLKYKTLEFSFSKDGVCQDMKRAQYCNQRYERGIQLALRFLELNNLLPE